MRKQPARRKAPTGAAPAPGAARPVPGGDALYRAAIETSTDGFLLLDAAGRILEVNSAYVKRSGYAREELQAMRVIELEARESPEETAGHIAELLRAGSVIFETLHRAKDGSVWQCEVNASHWDIEGGRFCCFLRDITGRKRAAEALRASEERFQLAMRGANDGLWDWDLSTDEVYYSPRWKSMLGYAEDELEHTIDTWKRLVHQDDREPTLDLVRSLIDRRTDKFEVQFRMWHKDGSLRHILSRAFLAVAPDGRPRRLVGTHVDMTERTRIEEELRASRQQYQQLFTEMTSGILVFDVICDDRGVPADYRLVDANPACGRISNIAIREFIGKTGGELPFGWSPELLQRFFEVAATGRSIQYERYNETLGRHYETHVFSPRPGQFVHLFQDVTERKRVEERVRQSDATFRGILDSLNEAVCILDAAGTFTDVNRGAERLYGYSHADLVGRTLALVSAPGMNDLGRVMEQCRLAFAGTPQRLEFWGLSRDRRVFLQEVHLYPGGYFGRPAAVAIAQDITERRQAESRLQSSEREYRELVQTANSVILTWNTAGEITFLNDFAERFFGFGREELLGKNVIGTIVPPTESSGRDLAQLMGEIQTDPDRFRDNENENLRKDGTRVWVRWANKAITDEEGRLAGVLSVGHDITARRQAEARLAESEQFIRGILDTVDEGFIVVDRDYRILTANKAYCRQAGKPADEVIGRSCFAISHRAGRPCHEEGEECAVRVAFTSGEPGAAVHRHQGPDGHLLYVETKAFPIKDAAGTITSVIETLTNITEKHLLAEERLRAQKLESIGTLAGGIAHDFNNLLQGVFGYISMAKMKLDEKERALAMLEQAEKALHLSVGLTKQLLTFSKGGTPVKKLIDLAPVVENAVKFALSGSNVDYRIRIAPGLRMVEVDEGQLGQVLQNIVLNADQAMPLGGTISIVGRNLRAPGDGVPPALAPGDYVAVSVQDSGIGIPEQYLSKLFDPYFTTKEKGSGLGLATSYSIVRNHGGVIDVASAAGAGTTFTIYLPAAVRVAAPPEPPAAVTAALAGKVLVMDDEEVVRDIAGEMIRALGHEVEVAEHGAEAIRRFREAREGGRPFDVVVLDLTIRGGMGGKETLERLRELDPAVRAIVSSGYSDDAVVADYQAHGFRARLSKPYRIDELQAVLATLLAGAPPTSG
jgi:PAS domain S-box-containing protein